MATPTNSTNPNRFHNLSPSMLADLIGQLDRKAKDATAELDSAKDAADVIEALRQAYEGTEGSATLTQENAGSLLYISGTLVESAHRTASSLPYSIIEKRAA